MDQEKPIMKIEGETLYAHQFFTYLFEIRHFSVNTASAYFEDVCDFTLFLTKERNKDLLNATMEDAEGWIIHLVKTDISKRSIKRKVSALKAFYIWMIVNKKREDNPFEYVATPKFKNRLPEFLTEKDFQVLIDENAKRTDKMALRDQAILELMFASGLRASEVVNLKVSNINFSNRTMTVLGKGHKERIVPFSKNSLDTLNQYLTLFRPNVIAKNGIEEDLGYLFLNSRGEKLTNRGLEFIMNQIALKTGIMMRLHPHMLRHSFATDLLGKGADLRMIQELMGHASVRTTSIYTHVNVEQLIDTYNKAFPRAFMSPEEKEKQEEKDESEKEKREK